MNTLVLHFGPSFEDLMEDMFGVVGMRECVKEEDITELLHVKINREMIVFFFIFPWSIYKIFL